MAIYLADNLSDTWPDTPNACDVTRDFKLTALSVFGTTKLLQYDIIVLAPLPTSGFVLTDYFIETGAQGLDTSTGITLDLGDNKVLAGAQTGVVKGAQTTPALATTTFTLTMAASTTSFATGGIVMVNGLLIAHTGKSGSTLTGCTAIGQGIVLPDGSNVVECTNTAAFNAVAVVGQSSADGYMLPWGNIVSTTATAATVVAAALPTPYTKTFTTSGANLAPAAQIGPYYLILSVHASATTAPTFTTSLMKGWYRGHYFGSAN